ncbi:MAG TPA: hypothetical protein VG319_01765 [Polyangia bacterium]|nr:hypothetical protein [Polyangia bacterium]
MTLSHDDANARLLELVYGEAAPAERAALEGHVATCARCTADLAALGDTRERLRAALDDDEALVPARAHARILEAANAAAAAAARARAGDPAARAPAVAAAPARQVSARRAPSFWERLRARWTFPTLATVGAVAVVVIASKVFLEPERTMEAGREVATGSAPPVAAPPPPASAPAEEPRATEPPRLDPRLLDKLSDAAAKRGRYASGGSRPGLFGATSAAQRLARVHGSAAGLNDFGAAPSAVAGGATPSVGGGSAAPSGLGGFASPPSGWKGGAPSAGVGSGPGGPGARSAAPAAAALAPEPSKPSAAPRAQAAPTRRALGKRGVASNAFAEDDAPGGAVPVAPAPESDVLREEQRSEGAEKASEAEPADKRAKPPKDAITGRVPDAPRALKKSAPAAMQAASAPAKDEKDEKERKSDDAASREALARRADELFAARRWSEAVEAYRELLRRYPDADLKTRWRARLRQAQAANEAAPEGEADRAAAKASAASKSAPKAKAAPTATPAE